MDKVYAGIGSRETPDEVCHAMRSLAQSLGNKGWTLRSGRGKKKVDSKPNTSSADHAFEAGARSVLGKCEIFLPNEYLYKSIEEIDCYRESNYIGDVVGSVLGCKIIARLLHPNGKNLTPQALELHARNTYQIIGKDLNSPVNFVVCWTENGELKGGTAQAIRLAKLLNIPIINYGLYNDSRKYWELNEYILSVYGSY